MKEQLRIEAEKFVESILAYPTQINFTKSELTQYLLDFHAQQSKERDVMTDYEIRELKANEYLKKVGTHDNPDTTKHDFLQGFDTAIKLNN